MKLFDCVKPHIQQSRRLLHLSSPTLTLNKSLHALAPADLIDLLHPLIPSQKLPSSGASLLSIPDIKLWAPPLWNAASLDVFFLKKKTKQSTTCLTFPLVLSFILSVFICGSCPPRSYCRVSLHKSKSLLIIRLTETHNWNLADSLYVSDKLAECAFNITPSIWP